ncbi:MAG: T9SS type A sorting domain-containing protein, partial [Thermoflavifilum sp.]|nr:T9SS type A sorting domain-containing protein [Thermoflavifilum sp.]
YVNSDYTYNPNPYYIQCPGPFPSDNTKTYVISVNYNSGSVTLPVTLVSFTGHYQSGLGVQLQWTTSSEYNSNYFAVERSSDGVQFQNIGEVPAQGNSQTTHSYGFTDASVLKHAGTTFYYRLREVDLDGKSTYSQVIAIQIPGFNELVLWPNPNNGSFNLQLPVSDNQPVELRIVNSSGAVVQRLKTSDAYVQLQLPNAASGLYFVQVRYPDGTVKTLKMLVVK